MFVCTKNINVFKTSRVDACLSSHCPHSTLLMHKWRSVHATDVLTTVLAGIQQKTNNTNTQKSSEMDECCQGLTFIRTKPCKARRVGHVLNTQPIAEISVSHCGLVSVKCNTWWGFCQVGSVVTTLSSYYFDAVCVNISCSLSTQLQKL